MGVAGMGMDLTQAAYRYNQNMMEYYTCKSELGLAYDSMSTFLTTDITDFFLQVMVESTNLVGSSSTAVLSLTLSANGLWTWRTRESDHATSQDSSGSHTDVSPKYLAGEISQRINS